MENIAGDASHQLKETAVEWLQFYTSGGDFGDFVGQRIVLTELSLIKDEDSAKPMVRIVGELTVERDMCNYMESLQGACSTWLVDLFTGLSLALDKVLRGVKSSDELATASNTLSMTFHAPAPVGTRIKVVSTSLAVGSRVASGRAEIWDTGRKRLVASGVHVKVPAPPAMLSALKPKL